MEEAPVSFEQMQLILISALCSLPKEVTRVHQFIGTIDAFGWMNSRLGVVYTPVAAAMHHLNRQIPFYLDAVSVIESVI
jgi:hypothetical protein